MRVALDHRAEAVVEVPHLVAVDVPDLRALAALEVDRPRVAQLVGGGDARAEDLVGATEHLGRAAGAVVEAMLLALDQVLDALAIQRDGRRDGHFSLSSYVSAREGNGRAGAGTACRPGSPAPWRP